jgi:hypothetical protein
VSVSKRTIDLVFEQLKVLPKGATYTDLEKLTGYSRASLKQAISNLTMTGSISATKTKPVRFRAVETPPLPAQTLIVHKPIPAIELDMGYVEFILKELESKKIQNDELKVVLYDRLRNNTPEKLEKLRVFLINFTEVLRIKLDVEELSIEDLDGK